MQRNGVRVQSCMHCTRIHASMISMEFTPHYTLRVCPLDRSHNLRLALYLFLLSAALGHDFLYFPVSEWHLSGSSTSRCENSASREPRHPPLIFPSSFLRFPKELRGLAERRRSKSIQNSPSAAQEA
jgi:hypothetical protein